jgi:hypothetical protein
MPGLTFVKYFNRWEQNEPCLLFSCYADSAFSLLRTIEKMQSDESRTIEIMNDSDMRIFSRRPIELKTTREDYGLQIQSEKLIWSVSKQTWERYCAMIESLAKSNSEGHHYLEPDLSSNNDISVQVSKGEYTADWWGWRESDDPWTFFGTWSKRDIEKIRELLQPKGIDYYTNSYIADKEVIVESYAWDESAENPYFVEDLWIFDFHIPKIGNILKKIFLKEHILIRNDEEAPSNI